MVKLLLPFTAIAAYFDLRTRRIPNWLTLAGCLLGLSANFYLTGLAGFQSAALGLLTGFALYLPLWLLHARGAGDVKLLAASGSFLGPYNTLVLAIVAALVGGVLAIVLVVTKRAGFQTATNILNILHSLIQFRQPVHSLASQNAIRLPHALVIFLAAAILVGIRNG